MEKFTSLFRGTLNKMNTVGLRNIPIQKYVLTAVLLILAVIISVPIIRKIFLIPMTSTKNYREMESHFKESCANKELLLNKKALDYVNTQQFSALRAFKESKINFGVLCSILKFGLEGLDNFIPKEENIETDPSLEYNVMSKDIALNPALLDDKRRFEYDLHKNSIAGVTSQTVEESSPLIGTESKLSIEEKVLYSGLGLIAAYNDARSSTKQSSLDEGDTTGNLETINPLSAKDRILDTYFDTYASFCDESNVDFDSLIRLLDRNTLIEMVSRESVNWITPLKETIDRTSLVLILRMSESYKISDKPLSQHRENIMEMIIDKNDFYAGSSVEHRTNIQEAILIKDSQADDIYYERE